MDVVLILVIGTLAMVILAMGIVFFFLIYQKRIQDNELQLNRIKTEHQQNLIKTSVLAEEKERKRFAEDLHDQVGAMLSLIKLNISRLEKKAENNQSQTLAKETKQHLDDVITQVRKITRALLPSSLEKFGLHEAITELIKWVPKSNELTVEYWKQGQDYRFEQKKETATYRIFQELLNNAIKHSQASKITVKLKYTPTKVFLSVSDNGKGFDKNLVEAKGLGLTNLESRAEILDGKFKIYSNPNQGTWAITYTAINNT